jgi:hypothetical protein
VPKGGHQTSTMKDKETCQLLLISSPPSQRHPIMPSFKKRAETIMSEENK